MKQYFMSLELSQPKNKAQEVAQEFAKHYRDCLIDETMLEAFKMKIANTVKRINSEHPRCTDLNFRVGKLWRDEQEHQISIDGGIYFTVRHVKRFELSKSTGRDPVYDLMGDMKADAH